MGAPLANTKTSVLTQMCVEKFTSWMTWISHNMMQPSFLKTTVELYSWLTHNRCQLVLDIREFALVDWVLQDLLILEGIKTADNCADTLTKAFAKILFYRHNDTIMGRRTPSHLLPWIITETGSNIPQTTLSQPATTYSQLPQLDPSKPKNKGG
jgi:hypothetical protein